MYIFFIDDSIQNRPSRPKMGPMVSVGGFVAQDSSLKQLGTEIDALCIKYRFPVEEPFKWSPGKELWMYSNLVDTERLEFQLEVLALLSKYDCRAIFIAEDKNCKTAECSQSHEIDSAKLLIERVDWFLTKQQSFGIVVVDRQSGDQKKEEAFLRKCLEMLRLGTGYRTPSNVILPVLSSPSRLSRLLQAADLITGCTLAYVSGEEKYSPVVMPKVLPLFIRESDRVGGVGVKLHPFLKYGNFYHWLFGDTHYLKGNIGVPFPLQDIAFKNGPNEY